MSKYADLLEEAPAPSAPSGGKYADLTAPSSEESTGALERAGRHIANFPLHVTQALGRSAVGLYGMLRGDDEATKADRMQRWREYSENPENAMLRVDEPKGEAQTFGQKAADLIGRDIAPVIGEAIALPLGKAAKAPAFLSKATAQNVGREAARGFIVGAQSGDLGESAKSAAMWGAGGGVASIPGNTLTSGLLRSAGQGAIPVAAAAIDPNRDVLSEETLVEALVQGGFGAVMDPQLGGRAVRGLFRKAPKVIEPEVEVLPPEGAQLRLQEGADPRYRGPRRQIEWPHGEARTHAPSGEPIAADYTPPAARGESGLGLLRREPKAPRHQPEPLPQETGLRLEGQRYSPPPEPTVSPMRSVNMSGQVILPLGRPIAGGVAGALLPAEDEDAQLRNIAAGAVTGLASYGLIKSRIPTGAEARRLQAKAQNVAGPQDFRTKTAVAMGNLLNTGRQDATLRAQERSRGISAEAIRPATEAASALRTPQMEAMRANPTSAKAMADFVDSEGLPAHEATLRAAVPDETVANALVEAKRAQVKAQKIISQASLAPRTALIDKTLGTYQRRAFAIDLKPQEWVKDDALFQKVVDQWHSTMPKAARGEVEMALDAYLASRLKGTDYNPGVSAKISQHLFTARKPLTPELKQLLGEITDPIERQHLTTQKLAQSTQQAEFINQVSATKRDDGVDFSLDYSGLDAARKAGKDVSDYVRLGDSPGFGKLANRYVPVDVARVVDPPPQTVLDALGKIPWLSSVSNWSKEAVTVMNPATHARQIIQTPLFMLAARANPKFLPETIKALADPSSAVSSLLREEHVIGANFATAELAKLAKQLGKNPGLLRNTRSMARFLYSLPDDALRGMTYLTALKRFGGDRNKALDFTNARTPNYGAVSPLVKGLRNLPVVSPFITFTAELLRISRSLAHDTLHGKTAVDKAMAAAGLGGLFGIGLGLDAATRSRLSPEERREWDSTEKLMPSTQRHQAKMVLGKNKGGGRDFIGMSSLTPGGDILSLARMISAGDWQNVIEQNPFIGLKAPVAGAFADVVRGEHGFTKQPIRTVGEKAERIAEVLVPPIIPPGYEGKKIAGLFRGGGKVENPYTGATDTAGKALIRNVTGINVQSAKRSSLLRTAAAERDREIRRVTLRAKNDARVAPTAGARKRIFERANEQKRKIDALFKEKAR